MQGRFFFIMAILALGGCVTSGGYTRSPVITPQVLDCGAAGRAEVSVWSPAEADLRFMNRVYTLHRDDHTKGAYYKGDGIEYANKGVFGLIRTGGTTYQCDVRPRDLEPELPPPQIVPEQNRRVEPLDVTPYL